MCQDDVGMAAAPVPQRVRMKAGWRKKYANQKIMGLDKAYKEIFSSKKLHENLSKINGELKDNELVNEVITFIEKDKKRPICSPIK